MNPYELKDEEYAELLSEALYLKHHDATMLERSVLSALAKAFNSDAN